MESVCDSRDKIKKMKKEYKKIKDYHNETGRKRRKEWKFFEKMDEILERNQPHGQRC